MADTDDTNAAPPAGSAPRPPRPVRAAHAEAGHGGGRTGFIHFIGECREELRRVQWPNREQLFQSTVIVIVLSFVIGAYLYGLDQVFSQMAGWLIQKQAG